MLLIPILVWNIAFRHLLPESYSFNLFWADLPPIVFWGENFFRLLAYIIPAFIPLRIINKRQKAGLYLYLSGLFIYFLSWRPLILFPESDWSTSMIGFAAPAFTPFLILAGIGLLGNRFFFRSKFKYKPLVYIFIAGCFTCFHVWHVLIVYAKLNY